MRACVCVCVRERASHKAYTARFVVIGTLGCFIFLNFFSDYLYD